MDDFTYKDGSLHCERMPATALADKYGTPLYVYSQRTLVEHFERFRRAFSALNPQVCYSVKCCHNLHILEILHECGAAFDIVSGGELARVLRIGVDPSRIVFAGVGKTDDEIGAALRAGIGWFNAESEAEIDNIARIAREMDRVANVALRVNPDVDPQTHVYTTTGKRETKFGVDLERARRVFLDFAGQGGIRLHGIHLHLGSPVNQIEPYAAAIPKTLTAIEQLRADGHTITTLNIGGGFGAHYNGSEAPPAAAYAERLVPLLKGIGLTILMEPGRCIAANAGILLARVLYTKRSGDKEFVIVDAAMTELIRPALYGSFHFAWPVTPGDGLVPPQRRADLALEGTALVDIVGPVCESGDFLAKDRRIPPVTRGDLIAIFGAGAYGAVMASQYNSRPRAAEVLVAGDSARVIRRRETVDEMFVLEQA